MGVSPTDTVDVFTDTVVVSPTDTVGVSPTVGETPTVGVSPTDRLLFAETVEQTPDALRRVSALPYDFLSLDLKPVFTTSASGAQAMAAIQASTVAFAGI